MSEITDYDGGAVDVLIVGSGIAGLSVGAMLGQAGLTPLIVDALDVPGGRARSLTHDGFRFDYGAHGLSREGQIDEVYDRLGKSMPSVVPHDDLELYHDGEWINPADVAPREEIKRLYGEIVEMDDDDIRSYDDVSLREWVDDRTDDDRVHTFFHFLGIPLLGGNRYEVMSASQVFYILRDNLRRNGSMKGYFLEHGEETLADPLVEAYTEAGGTFLLGTRVHDLITEDGAVTGVRIEREDALPGQIPDTDRVEAEAVVSTVPLWNLFDFVDETDLEPWNADRIRNVKDNWAYVWTAFSALEEPLWDSEGYKVHLELPHTGCAALRKEITTVSPSAAPDGKGLMMWILQGNSDDLPNVFDRSAAAKREVRRVRNDLERDIAELTPNYDEEKVLWTKHHVGRYNVALDVGYTGTFRPTVDPPGLDGLYLASDTIRSRGVGVNAAAYSALQCVEAVLDERGD